MLEMRKLFSPFTWMLWFLLIIVAVLYGGTVVGIDWNLPANRTLGRLLMYPEITGTEVLLAVALLGAVSISRTKPDWKVVGISVVSIGFAIYHLLYFSIGIEIFLMMPASQFIRVNSRQA
jgi:hypothetical protein